MSKIPMSVVPALFALTLAGCGGGGGGSNPAPAPAPAPAALTMTSANSKAVAADALENAAGNPAAEAGASLATGVQVEGAGAPSATLQLAAAARKLASLVPAQTPLATGVAINESIPCSGGGTLTISGNVSGGDALVAGDNVTLGATNCRETVDGVLQTMSGSMTLQITSGSMANANVYPFHIVMSMTMNAFSIAGGGVTNRADGDLQLDVTASSATADVTVLSGTSLSSTTTNSLGTRKGTLKNYRQSMTRQGTIVSTDVTATIESTNSRLGTGTVRYDLSTPAPLVSNASTGAYTAGSMKIVGSNSALLVTVSASNTFSVQVDGNGDGTYESSSSATLSELQALL
ncbi:hypothetical protein GCM10027034_45680 [Ramlibacter solisilvae]|uniref:Lipoprotein n=1 Tax=Ramlibacter tataouinensis TaxID=94132 RepID=A0A127JSW2_9BURK|nr:hypothetical protein [Ramlibacter tataouinensis]AMO23009.1 hypothetical protein UC35_09050 [Ramlibacter tataouinensis]